MHLVHKAGEKIFIDFSGKTVDIINPKNGVITHKKLTDIIDTNHPLVKLVDS